MTSQQVIKRSRNDIDWYGCYVKSSDIWNRESGLHPAKAPFALMHRIFEHAEETGFLKKDDIVLDPFSGAGTTAMVAVSRGYKAVTIELEQNFFDIQAGCKCSGYSKDDFEKIKELEPGNPAFYAGGLHICPECQRYITSDSASVSVSPHDYVGNKQVLSEHLSREGLFPRVADSWTCIKGNATEAKTLLAWAGVSGRVIIITSPPYFDAISNHSPENQKSDKQAARNIARAYMGGIHYSNNPENIGNNEKRYRELMPAIYKSLAELSSGIVTITKNTTKKKKLVRLDKFTTTCLRQAGYKLTDYHRAILWGTVTNVNMFDGAITKPKGRIALFKRYDYVRGIPVARWEDILFGVRP